MKIDSAPLRREFASPAKPTRKPHDKALSDDYKNHGTRKPGWLAWSVGALACTAALPSVSACDGLNPMHKGWTAPPAAWPSPTTYGDVLVSLASYYRGPACFDTDSEYDYQATFFFQRGMSCNNVTGVGFCASNHDFKQIDKVAQCSSLNIGNPNFTSDQPLRPLDNCGLMRAKDCIFFVPDGDSFQDIEDNFVRIFDPTCAGFNPLQSRWMGHNVSWPSPTNASAIGDIANACSVGPACGSAFNHAFRSFNCSGQAGTIIGQSDLDLAFDATRAACPTGWQELASPPAGDLIFYNQPQVQQAWDVGFFFSPAGSSLMDASLLLAAQRELMVLRHVHDARYMWRTGLAVSAVASAASMLTYGLAQGSVVRKLGVGVGMGYAAASIGVAVGGVMLGYPRIDRAGGIVVSTGVGLLGAAYLGTVGVLVARRLR